VITLTLTGADRVDARWAGFPARIRQGLEQAITQLGDDLAARVQQKLGGEVLRRRSGRLASAQQAVVTSDGDGVSVAVGFDAQAVPYGAIQEFGGTTRAHLIAVKAARALAFNVGGRLVFAKSVQHPGSVLPERSFLRSSLADMAEEGGDALAASVQEAVSA
jgi:phage gpG-like protein